MKIAIQGELGSFHHEAAQRYYSAPLDIVACESFSEVFGALNRHDADAAVIAIENSLYGSINEVYDLIESHRYPVVGEVYLRVEQQLVGLPGAPLSGVDQVYSHPVALAQCEHFLETNLPNAQQVAYHDTAAAAEYIAQQANPAFAAIASRAAASLHGLPILRETIEDNKANYTRFMVIEHRKRPIAAAADKASLVVETNHKPGALAKILTIFADAGVNISKLQSRPIIGEVWRYRFYIDVETAGPALHRLLAQCRADSAQVTVLGEYKCDTLSP